MAKIARKVAKIFGSTAGLNQITEFGSLAAGTPVYTTDPTVIQSLSNYLQGWFAAVVGSNSPAIEDMNALCYLFAYQLAYIMQEGIAEWDATTTYYIGSLVNNGSGIVYVSLTDNNLGNALSSTANWAVTTSQINIVAINPATQSPYVMSAGDSGKTFEVNSANGAMQFNLPAPTLNFNFRVKDVSGNADTSAITISRNGSETIEKVASNYVCESPFGTWAFGCDGTNYAIF